MTTIVTEPDLILRLNALGVITSVHVGSSMTDEALDDWVGKDWIEVVDEGERGKLANLLSAARDGALCCELSQRFPSGTLLPLDVTALDLGAGETLVVARQQRLVAQLQSRLLDVQRTMEQDYWRLRRIETRWRLLFDDTTESLVSVEASGRKIRDINAAAAVLLGVSKRQRRSLRGADLRKWLVIESRVSFDRLLDRLLEEGAAPAVSVRLTSGARCLLRATIDGGADASLILLRFAPGALPVESWLTAGRRDTDKTANATAAVPIDALIERSPDGYVVTDPGGRILRANSAFADLAQVGSVQALIGTSLSDWVGRPGADFQILLSNLKRNGSVRLYASSMRGQKDTQVELSAVGDNEQDPSMIGFMVRSVGRRLDPHPPRRAERGSDTLLARLGHEPLKVMVDEAIAEVERSCVAAALATTGQNRTAAAQMLGLSRQTLHGKMKRYGLTGGADEQVGGNRVGDGPGGG